MLPPELRSATPPDELYLADNLPEDDLALLEAEASMVGMPPGAAVEDPAPPPPRSAIG